MNASDHDNLICGHESEPLFAAKERREHEERRLVDTDHLQSLHKFLTTHAACCLTIAAVKRFRHILTLVCLVASFVAHAGEPPAAKSKEAASQPIAEELQPLQGTWEGFMVSDQSPEKVTITISTNSLHFHRDKDFWFKTTFTLPVKTDPKQLRATIKEGAAGQDSSVGKVVVAIYKIEDGALTLAALGDDEEEWPKSFEAAEKKGLTRYKLWKAKK